MTGQINKWTGELKKGYRDGRPYVWRDKGIKQG